MNKNRLVHPFSFILHPFEELLLGHRGRDGQLSNQSFHLNQTALLEAAERTLSQVVLDFGRWLLGTFGRQQTSLNDRAVHDLSLSCS